MKADKLPHRYRKNGASAEAYAKLRKAANAARSKQVWDAVLKQWVRA